MTDKPKRLTIIRLPPQQKDVYFIVRDMSDGEYGEYAVKEGCCPHDLFLSGCDLILTDGDSDPHGLFEFVRTIDRPEFMDRSHSPDAEWPKVIPEAYPVVTDK